MVLKGYNELFANPIYLVNTIDPKFTVFFVECSDAEDLKEKTQNLSYYAGAIA